MGWQEKGMSFDPYIGNDYFNQSKKILLLGESHYENVGEGRGKTIRVANDYINGKYNYRFFNCALSAFFGKDFTREDIMAKIAYYNFVQVIMETRKHRPTKEHWAKAERPFLCVLEELMPDIVICCGKSLYGHVPYDPSDTEKSQRGVSIGGDDEHLWNREYHYHINGKDIKLVAMRHPSSHGFNAENYYERIFSAIN